jgi:hypothetical protein
VTILRGSLRQHNRTIAEAEKLANGDAGKIDKPFWKLEILRSACLPVLPKSIWRSPIGWRCT